MAGPEFFQTRMGMVFYESTCPEIARQLKRVADALEAGATPALPTAAEACKLHGLTPTKSTYDPEERLKKGFEPDTRGWNYGPDDTAYKVEAVLRSFEYDTAHYVTEKLGDRVYFDTQMHDLVNAVIKAVLR